jgi:anaerobic sulfite reductase subunit B
MSYLPKEYKIEKIKKETEEVNLFTVKTDIDPEPGQFFQVSIPGVGECPLASCSSNSKEVDMLVRNVGTVTKKMFDLVAGDGVGIRGPYGKGFPIKKLKGKNLVLIAGGTGIAPVTSLIEYAEKNRKQFGKVEIYFGFRSKENILLKERLERWKKKFKVIIALDKAEKGWAGEVGFLNSVILEHNPDKKSIALLCGPEIMMKLATDSLNKIGIENNKIYWSLERRMECGMGSCGRCLIQDVYVCKDGPVFRYDLIKPKLDNEEASNKL